MHESQRRNRGVHPSHDIYKVGESVGITKSFVVQMKTSRKSTIRDCSLPLTTRCSPKPRRRRINSIHKKPVSFNGEESLRKATLLVHFCFHHTWYLCPVAQKVSGEISFPRLLHIAQASFLMPFHLLYTLLRTIDQNWMIPHLSKEKDCITSLKITY